MPNATTGFTGSEIVTHVQNWIGNQSSDFQTLVQNFLPLAEYRYCKLFPWHFLNKQNLALTVASGTNEYTLNTAAIGYEMAASDVQTVFSVTTNRVLKKTTLDRIRRMDPDDNEGTTAADLRYWAISGDNKIVVWPSTFRDTELKIDGTVQPVALISSLDSTYPTIPFRFQEGFIKYVIGEMLDRDNDSRAQAVKAEALAQAKMDYNSEPGPGDTDLPRFQTVDETEKRTILDNDPLNMRNYDY